MGLRIFASLDVKFGNLVAKCSIPDSGTKSGMLERSGDTRIRPRAIRKLIFPLTQRLPKPVQMQRLGLDFPLQCISSSRAADCIPVERVESDEATA